jgi:serine/threonine protein kinase
MGLIRNGRVLYFDSSAINSNGMQYFVNRNKSALLNNEYINIPCFEARLISDSAKSLINYLGREKAVKLNMTSSDYSTLLKELSKVYRDQGQLCFIVNDRSKKHAVINAARGAGLFVQIFQLGDDGNLLKDGGQANRQRKSHSGGFTIKDTPERMTITPIRLQRLVVPGTYVLDSKGQRILVGEKKLSHLNAVSYATDKPGIWVKIFNENALNSYLFARITRMLSQDIQYNGLCWPIDIVRDTDGNPVGYLLPASKGYPLHLSVFKQAKLQAYFPTWTKKDMCDLTLTILRTIEYLHSKNILLGCLNPAAIHVAGKDEVYFLDTENYQVEGFPTLVYNRSFTPPDLLGRKIYLCKKGDENYAVAMLVFMIMMPGKMPYVIDAEHSVEVALRNRKFAFSHGSVHGWHAMPGMWRFMWSHLTPFKEVFYNTFQKGGRLDSPDLRKDVRSWIGTVEYFRKELENPYDRESLKIYPKTFKRGKDDTFYRCKLCGVEHPIFYFDREYFNDYRICNSCIDKKSNVSFTCKVCNKTFYYTNRTALYHRKMRTVDSDWKNQKYCHDCKSKTIKCSDCGREVEYYKVNERRCPDCYNRYSTQVYSRVTCKDCGTVFTITVGEHNSMVRKGFTDPVRCSDCRKRR